MISTRALQLAASLCLLTVAWTAIAEDKVKERPKVAGEPYQVHFEDGRVISFKVRQKFSPLHSTITLAENSCTKTIGVRAKYMIPIIQKSLIPVWHTHPQKQGQLVLNYDTDEKKNMVQSSTRSMSAISGNRYQHLFKSMEASQIEDPVTYEIQKKMGSAFGWIQCEGECKTLLPKTSQIRFWDENFENGNDQLRMTNDREAPSVNQMTSRLQEIELVKFGEIIFFGVPKKAFGLLAQFFPPGVTYQLQWTFQAPNLVETDDDLCQLKWDMDFTPIFTQLQNANNIVTDPALVKIEGLPDYLFDADDDQDLGLNGAFSNSTWENLKETP